MMIGFKEELPRRFYTDPPSWFGYILLIAGVSVIGVLFIGMLLISAYSFLDSDAFSYIIYQPTIDSWITFLTTPAYHTIYLRTLLMSIIITAAAITLALPYAYLTIRIGSSVIRKLLLVGIFIPFFTGVIVRAYGWLIILGREGLLNSVVTMLGINPINFIGNELGVGISLLQIMIPFAIIMIAPAIQNINNSLELAASNLGANRIETFRYVIIPLSLPGIAGAGIVVFTLTTTAYAIPDLIGGGLINFASNIIFSLLVESFNWPLASVFSIVLVISTSVFVVLVFRLVGTGTLGLEPNNTNE